DGRPRRGADRANEAVSCARPVPAVRRLREATEDARAILRRDADVTIGPRAAPTALQTNVRGRDPVCDSCVRSRFTSEEPSGADIVGRTPGQAELALQVRGGLVDLAEGRLDAVRARSASGSLEAAATAERGAELAGPGDGAVRRFRSEVGISFAVGAGLRRHR